MKRNLRIGAPFFEIGPKNYLYGTDVIDLALAADEFAAAYRINVIYTAPYVNIAEVAARTRNLFVFAPHMDRLPVGRGLADILPESIRAAGARGVMLNHSEKPLGIAALKATLARARDLDLTTIVCADSVVEAAATAVLGPDMLVCEPTELIGTGEAADASYAGRTMDAIAAINPNIGVLVGGGISSGRDAYNVILAGADGTGSSSGIALAKDPAAMAGEMLRAVREAWDARVGRDPAAVAL